MSLYSRRGVSAQKEEVHSATKDLDKGLYPFAFCKIYPDLLGGDKDWINIMHADGAGTKSILAYLYWKETGDVGVWRGIAQDAVVMNLDDLLCVGIYDKLLFSSTIDRNKHTIPGEVLKEIIEGTQEFFDAMEKYGIRIQYMGGETADVGDLVRTIAVNGTMTARWPTSRIITNEKIRAGNVIVGFASYGQAQYESSYNSGIASNGLTSARHDVLEKAYGNRFPESYDPVLEEEVIYAGTRKMSDPSSTAPELSIGNLLLSPTRTFAPILKLVLEEHFNAINGLVHCSGGGQTKCLKYIPRDLAIIKDDLFDPPEIFRIIQSSSGSDDREMYQVFNMGTRMEIYTNEKDAESIISIAKNMEVDARIIGRVEEAKEKSLLIRANGKELRF